MNLFRQTSSGDPMNGDPAEWRNLLVEVAQDYLRRQKVGQQTVEIAPEVTLRVRNESGGSLAQYSIVALSTKLVAPEGADATFYGRAVFESTSPTAGSAFAIMQRPTADGSIGLARISGDSFCKIDVVDAGHGYADAITADYAKLQSKAAPGLAQILWKESGTGTKWALVRFNPGGTSVGYQNDGLHSGGIVDIDINHEDHPGGKVHLVTVDPTIEQVTINLPNMPIDTESNIYYVVVYFYNQLAYDAGEWPTRDYDYGVVIQEKPSAISSPNINVWEDFIYMNPRRGASILTLVWAGNAWTTLDCLAIKGVIYADEPALGDQVVIDDITALNEPLYFGRFAGFYDFAEVSPTPTTLADGDYGSVKVSGSGTVITIDAGAVAFSQMQAVSASILLGNDSAGTTVQEITVTGGIEFDSTTIRTTAFTGDVTKTAGGTALTIANDAVTYAKMQDVSATDKILGRVTAGAGDVEEVTFTDQAQQLCAAANYAAMRALLDLEAGTDFYSIAGADAAFQPLDATLTAFAALTIAANSLTIGTGADAFAQTTFAANTFPARASTGDLVAKAITDFGLSLVDDADAAAGRTTLGATTAGGNFFTLTNPSAITFPRINADNTVSALSASDFRTAIAAASTTHATTHQAGGSDPIKLDDLAATDDNTDLDASTTKHGLMQKYPNNTTDFLRADGTFTAPTAAINITGLSADDLAFVDEFPFYDLTDTTNQKATLARMAGFMNPAKCDGRLTLTTGDPVPYADVVSSSNLRFTPYMGNRIAISDGTRPLMYEFSEVTLALSGMTADLMHDVFIYDNAGTLTLEWVAWTNNTTRATALADHFGNKYKTGSLNKRYLGSFYSISTTQTADSAVRRVLCNLYNQVPRPVYIADLTNSFTATASGAYEKWNGTNTARVQFIDIGVDPHAIVDFVFTASGSNSAGAGIGVGIGLDSETVNSARGRSTGTSTNADTLIANMRMMVSSAGFHYAQMLQFGSASGTTTFFGDANTTFIESAMEGFIWA
jgi:hypothetical protein